MLTEVVALRVPHAAGSLSKAMHQIVEEKVNVEYMYAFANGSDAAAVLKSDDPEKVVEVLKKSGHNASPSPSHTSESALHKSLRAAK